jgi:glycosyltransferase involved in cell wall biosynthesis
MLTTSDGNEARSMKVIAFSEGSVGASPGIVSVPTINSSVAARGHHCALVLGGASPRGREMFEVPDLKGAAARKEGNGTFGVINVKARTRWAIAPSILWRFRKGVRDADFVSLHSLYSFPVFSGYVLSRLYRKPYGVWAHGVLAPFQREVSAKKKWIYNRLIAGRILGNASVIFFFAEGERAETVIIPDGFNAAEFSVLPPRGRFREQFLGGHQGPLILFLARLSAKKGLDVLIDAMKEVLGRHPDARLAVVGAPDFPPFGKQVSQWIKESGIESSIVVTGAADPKMRLEAFADADVYALPSYAENFGFSIFEAMASGVPVVVSDAINYAREIASAGAGLVVPRTPQSVARAISELIERPDLQAEMGLRGRALAGKYSIEETGAKIAATIQSIVEGYPLPAELSPLHSAHVSKDLK